MKILVTGGAGFIGSWLCESLLQDGHTVTAMDDLSTGSEENLRLCGKSSAFRFIRDDVITSSDLPRLVAEADCVVHLAAAVGVELVVHDPVRTIMTNVKGTERILSCAADSKCRCIVASTSEVYGKSSNPVFSETDDLLIGPSTHSRWSYACSKLLDEFMLMAYCRNRQLPGTVVRFFNTVGPRQTGRYGMVVPRFVRAALDNEPIRVFGTGTQTRCFCHVFDTVRALKLLIPDPRACGEVFNIGSTECVTIRQLAERVIARLNSRSEIRVIPYSEAYEEGFEDMLHRAPDCSKMDRFFQWHAQIPLDRIIDDVASSFKNA